MGVLYSQIECDWPREPRMLAAGPMARLLYIQFALYARENLLDGKLDRLEIPYISVDIPQPFKLLARLVEVGALEVTDTGWAIPMHVWRKRNPMRAEVEETKAAKKEAGERGNHVRHHVEKGVVSQTCRYCLAGCEGDASITSSQSLAKKKSESESQSESESELRSDLVNNSNPLQSVPEPDEWKRRKAIAKRFAEHAWATANQQMIRNPRAFKNDRYKDALANPELERLEREYPDAPADILAAALTGDKHSLAYHRRVVA